MKEINEEKIKYITKDKKKKEKEWFETDEEEKLWKVELFDQIKLRSIFKRNKNFKNQMFKMILW